MKPSAYGLSDVGTKREHNEDFVLIDPDLGLHVVCDGVGGHLAGEVASAACAQVIQAELRQRKALITAYADAPSPQTRAEVVRAIDHAVRKANQTIFKLGIDDAKKRGMGTTLVLLLCAGPNAVIAHVGDSRAYLIRSGKVNQLTEDHSLVQDMIKKGLITPERAAVSEFAHVITRAVGTQEAVELEVLHLEVAPSDLFVLCSDGLSEHFKRNELMEIVARTPEDARIPEALIKFANDCGGRDNITAAVVRIEGMERANLASEIERKIDTIRKIPLFRYLSYTELNKVLGIVTLRQFKPEERIIIEDQQGEEMFILLSGKVRVMKRGKNLAVLETGSFFGEMQLVDSAPRSASITAVEPTSAMVISRHNLYPLLRRDQQMAVKLLWEFCQVLNARIRSLNELFVGSKDLVEGAELPTLPFLMPNRE